MLKGLNESEPNMFFASLRPSSRQGEGTRIDIEVYQRLARFSVVWFKDATIQPVRKECNTEGGKKLKQQTEPIARIARICATRNAPMACSSPRLSCSKRSVWSRCNSLALVFFSISCDEQQTAHEHRILQQGRRWATYQAFVLYGWPVQKRWLRRHQARSYGLWELQNSINKQ